MSTAAARPAATQPARPIPGWSARPTALPTRTLAAVVKPSAHMKTREIRFIATWKPANWAVPISPANIIKLANALDSMPCASASG